MNHLGTRKGGGNHRCSIFRLHVGKALLALTQYELRTWGVGSTAPSQIRAYEEAWENRVSDYIGKMPVYWINVPDDLGLESERAKIERNAIALLSNKLLPTDVSSNAWLGRFSPQHKIRASSLWNVDHVEDVCDIRFLDRLEWYVEFTSHSQSR
jgi:hypothetical protein